MSLPGNWRVVYYCGPSRGGGRASSTKRSGGTRRLLGFEAHRVGVAVAHDVPVSERVGRPDGRGLEFPLPTSPGCFYTGDGPRTPVCRLSDVPIWGYDPSSWCMSSSDTPALVRTTGLDLSEGSAALEAEASRLRRTVDTLEQQLAETEATLDEREDELAATRARLDEREGDLERAREWAEFLDSELRAQQERIDELEAEQSRQAERHEQVVERYEALLAERETEESDRGLFARLRALF